MFVATKKKTKIVLSPSGNGELLLFLAAYANLQEQICTPLSSYTFIDVCMNKIIKKLLCCHNFCTQNNIFFF